jgi:hypothetical protein
MTPSLPQTESPQLSSGDSQEADLEIDLALVRRVEGRVAVLDYSPLTPSRPGCAGDRGSVGGVGVVDVVEEAGEVLHVLETHPKFAPGEIVKVQLDSERRDRLERTHAACVLARAQLAHAGTRVVSVEITAGLAWIEVNEAGMVVDLSSLAALDLPLAVRQPVGCHMVVDCCGTTVTTFAAPIARSSSAISGAEMRVVAALDSGVSALEIALPDSHGTWWR